MKHTKIQSRDVFEFCNIFGHNRQERKELQHSMIGLKKLTHVLIDKHSMSKGYVYCKP